MKTQLLGISILIFSVVWVLFFTIVGGNDFVWWTNAGAVIALIGLIVSVVGFANKEKG